ncbi:hypothetical protein [Nesterenkonia sp. AN1]|uniref:hypothetical protein n=1 Tax=Nesterenkonia sp. AN1 TaxID=652017 RepID=UPI001F444BCF|nr:hypothetical protein [Nesterenkonia sp. AN1]
MSEYYQLGKTDSAPHAIAGVAEPPTAQEMNRLADLVLAGMYRGDIDSAFDRAGAFCRVIARGQALWAGGLRAAQSRIRSAPHRAGRPAAAHRGGAGERCQRLSRRNPRLIGIFLAKNVNLLVQKPGF